jgi:sulfopyruvate decarboxylase alpha subunit
MQERQGIMPDKETGAPSSAWPLQIYGILKSARVRQVCYVPDAGHAQLIELCTADASLVTTSLTTEEEGVALCCGAWLGGQRSALLMQSSGVGNCINMLSMVRTCAFPFLTLVSMRGQWGEFVPWQIPIGQATPQILKAVGVIVQEVDSAENVSATVEAAAKLAFDGGAAVAVLLSQRLIGTKGFKQ